MHSICIMNWAQSYFNELIICLIEREEYESLRSIISSRENIRASHRRCFRVCQTLYSIPIVDNTGA